MADQDAQPPSSGDVDVEADRALEAELASGYHAPPLSVLESFSTQPLTASLVGEDAGLLSLTGARAGVVTAAADELTLPDLPYQKVEARVYQQSAKGGAKWLEFLGLNASQVKAGAMQETKRYRVQINPNTQRRSQIGVSVRMVVAVDEWEGRFNLSVPTLAAAAELEMAGKNARIGIDVIGYNGSLGSLLPAPEALDVTSYANYFTAFQKIQRLVFSEKSLPLLRPSLLGPDDDG